MQIPAPMIKFPIQQASLGFMSQVMWGNLEYIKESSMGADGPDEPYMGSRVDQRGVAMGPPPTPTAGEGRPGRSPNFKEALGFEQVRAKHSVRFRHPPCS